MIKQFYYKILILSIILFLFSKGDNCNKVPQPENTSLNKITLTSIVPSTLPSMNGEFQVKFSYNLTGSNSKNCTIYVAGLYPSPHTCIALNDFGFLLPPTSATFNDVATINTSLFASNCRENNREYAIQFIMEGNPNVFSNSLLFTVGDLSLNCIPPNAQTKTITLEHDFTTFGNSVYNFRKDMTNVNNSNPEIINHFNPAFNECKVNMNFYGTDTQNPSSSNDLFDFENSQVIEATKLRIYTQTYWNNPSSTLGYIVSVDKFSNINQLSESYNAV